jgi:hypothetical protein
MAVGAVCFIGYQAYRVIAPGRNTKKADQVAAAATTVQAQTVTVDQAARIVQQAVDEVKVTHAAEIATRDQMDKNATGFSMTAKEALKDEPSYAADVARMLIQYSIDALGVKVSAEEANKFIKMAAPLIAKNAAMKAEVERLHTEAVATAVSLKAETDRRVAAEAAATEATTTLKAQTTTLVKTSTVASKLAKENKAWADDAETLWDRIKALGWLSVALAALVVGVLVKLFGWRQVAQDTVALGEHLKGKLVASGHDPAKLEEEVKEWWQGSKNEAVVNAVKTDVLRQ